MKRQKMYPISNPRGSIHSIYDGDQGATLGIAEARSSQTAQVLPWRSGRMRFKWIGSEVILFLGLLLGTLNIGCNQGKKLPTASAEGDRHTTGADVKGELIQGYWIDQDSDSVIRIGLSHEKNTSSKFLDEGQSLSTFASETSNRLGLVMPAEWVKVEGVKSIISPNREISLIGDSNGAVWKGDLKLDENQSKTISQILVELQHVGELKNSEKPRKLNITWIFIYRDTYTPVRKLQQFTFIQNDEIGEKDYYKTLQSNTEEYFRQIYMDEPCSTYVEKGVRNFIVLTKKQNIRCAAKELRGNICSWNENEIFQAYTSIILNANKWLEMEFRDLINHCTISDKPNLLSDYFGCGSKQDQSCESRPIVGLLRNLLNNSFGDYVDSNFGYLVHLRKSEFLTYILPMLRKSYQIKDHFQIDDESILLFQALVEKHFLESANLLFVDPQDQGIWQKFIELILDPGRSGSAKKIMLGMFSPAHRSENIYSKELVSLKSKDLVTGRFLRATKNLWNNLLENELKGNLILAAETLDRESFEQLVELIPKNRIVEIKEILIKDLEKKINERHLFLNDSTREVIERRRQYRIQMESQANLEWIRNHLP